MEKYVHSIFLITGTPFVTNISYDFMAMTKACARGRIRAECTDEGLESLMKRWIPVSSDRYLRDKESQDTLRKHVAEILSNFMIRRDQKSKIRGQPVMVDYFNQCTNLEEPLQLDPPHILQEREAIYRRRFPRTADRVDRQKNSWMRCLSYSHRFSHWEMAKTPSERLAIWDGYTLEEGMKYVRTRALIDYLERGKATRNGVVIFCQRTFLLELSMKVPRSLLKSD